MPVDDPSVCAKPLTSPNSEPLTAKKIQQERVPVKLNTAKAICINVINRLKEKCEQGDPIEYIDILQYVHNVSSDFVRRDRQFLTDIDSHLSTFADLVNSLTSNNRLARYLLSSRLRRLLGDSTINHIRDISPSKDAPAMAVYLSASTLSQQLGDQRGPHSYPDIDRLPERVLSDCQDSRNFWEKSFGQSLLVDFETFISAFGSNFDMRDYSVTQLKYMLDYSCTGYVTLRKFATLIRGYGPFPKVLENVTTLFQFNWFHGYLSTKEAEFLLKPQPQGTFLVRFSKASCDAIVISCHLYSSSNEPIVHTSVTKAGPNVGFVVEDASRGRQEFPTLLGVVQRYNLTASLQSQMTKAPFFFGDIQGSEAGDLLADKPTGTYLVRFSSQANHFAITHISDRAVKHGLIEVTHNGFKLEYSPKVSQDLNEVIGQSPLLKTQLPGVPIVYTPNDQPLPGEYKRGGQPAASSPYPKATSYPSSLPQPAGNPTAQNYGRLPAVFPGQGFPPTPQPAPSSPTAHNPTANYGTLPSVMTSPGVGNSFMPQAPPSPLAAPSQNYGTLPSVFNVGPPVSKPPGGSNFFPPPSPMAAPQQNYGAFPFPGMNAGASPHTSQPSSPAAPAASNQNYGTLPSAFPPGFPPAIPAPMTHTAPALTHFAPDSTPASDSNYGAFPSPKSMEREASKAPASSPPQQQYSAFPSPGKAPVVTTTSHDKSRLDHPKSTNDNGKKAAESEGAVAPSGGEAAPSPRRAKKKGGFGSSNAEKNPTARGNTSVNLRCHCQQPEKKTPRLVLNIFCRP
ncbi:hypothetical protein PROFUN_09440 [Planoprotostelium fungivorum]|uniref:SH2 domain-containing protein n=1 Tax=Planoprotostelium fungivorum TaxID=1890364 RepID=A0A2P6NGZ4_9EUKA|nr:hypothetical protein PROFUN_09440 [Planoprotostelium fungivorum]